MSAPLDFTSASNQARLRRRAGVLLHPTSLPSLHGIGDFGPAATQFLNFLSAAGATLWQTLPLGPVGYGNSPYAARSAFAGNPLLISLELLIEQGLLPEERLAALPVREAGPVDFENSARTKLGALREAFDRLSQSGLPAEFQAFCVTEKGWLDDWALYATLSQRHAGRVWTDWEPAIARRLAPAMERLSAELERDLAFQRFLQWQFFAQWGSLRDQAKQRGIQIVGDLPIFVSQDSADVWSRPELFKLDECGRPTVVAGVPPDYFSETGQRWGNPVYRWDVLKQQGYRWWKDRLAMAFRLFDIVRIDHFRGFLAVWEIPAAEKTAMKGTWQAGPGLAFFESLEAEKGKLPIIVEDLGLITPDVVDLRDILGYPGTKVLQFAFDSGPDNPFLPFSYPSNAVVYTGTHDNDTTLGWYAGAPENVRDRVRRYCASSGADVSWDLTRAALASVADRAIVPMQDLLGLDGDGRMNFPGTAEGNWGWRYGPGDLEAGIASRFHDLVDIYGRLPDTEPSQNTSLDVGH